MAAAAECYQQKKRFLWLLVVAVWSCASADLGKPRTGEIRSVICGLSPPWTASGVTGDTPAEGERSDPMLEGRGKVMLVALTSASSHRSLEQAEKLGDLESYLQNNGMPDVKFILVNSAESTVHLPDLVSKNLSMGIFQENGYEPVWSKLGGKADYVFVYDRCGRLTHKLPFPLSIIHRRQQLVKSSVISAYEDDICGDQNCNSSNINEAKNATDDEKEDVDNDDSKHLESGGDDELEDMGTGTKTLEDPLVEQLIKSRKEGKPYRQETPTTPKPSFLNGLRSVFQNIMKHMPWASKNNKDERYRNSVQQFMDREKPEENPSLPELSEESEVDRCNITQKSICRAWPKKKLDHARVCCNLHTSNRSAQYLQKHCKHYVEHRCKKVKLVVKCCHTENNSHSVEEANTRASASSHPKS